MALSKEQLDIISTVLWDCAASYMDQTPYREAANAVDAEIDRRNNGPYSLAEAVASGRPFRRKGREHAQWMTADYLDTYSYADEFCGVDLVAEDYELQEGGE